MQAQPPTLHSGAAEKGTPVTLTDIIGYAAALLVLLTFSMRTMVHLRAVGIVSNLFFIAYGYSSGAYPIMLLHAILLPLNSFRLFQIIALLRKVEHASSNGFDVDWLKSIATPRTLRPGEFLYRKGDTADRMAFIVSGTFRVVGLGKDIGKGELTGELGLIAPARTRTQSLECTATAHVLEVTYEQVKLLYFQSPKFGLFLLQLAGDRLFKDIDRLEQQVEMYRHEKEVALLGAPIKREA